MKHLEIVVFVALCNWRDFGRQCFCFGSEAVNNAVNMSGEAVRGLVKSRFEFPPAGISPLVKNEGGSAARPSRIPPATQTMF